MSPIIGDDGHNNNALTNLIWSHNQLNQKMMKDNHYQVAWTLVGACKFNMQDTIRPEKDYIPKGVDWIKEYAEDIDPENNLVTIKNGDKYSYDYLVVAPGIKIDLSLIEGLSDTMDKNNVCSNYTPRNILGRFCKKPKKE
jgi:NADPH-dependent 2,4-dienoyl-CoA reductase/sulfur reductase-like enzyme